MPGQSVRWSTWLGLSLTCVFGGLLAPGVAGGQQAVCHDQWAAWAPEGESIVFVSTRTGDHEVYTLELSSGELTQLTDIPGRDAHPSFSPDGTRIAFQSPRDGQSTDLYVMDRDGSNVHRVTSLPGFEGMPVWSPDSERLAFQHRGPAAGDEARWTLMVVTIADGRITALTNGTSQDQVVNWAPDGERLTFHSDRTGINQVYLWEAGSVRQLTHGPHEHRNATWSHDGRQIALRSTRDGEPGIYLMDPVHLEPVRVGTVSPEHGLPFFSPDDSQLLITPSTQEGTRISLLRIDTGTATQISAACDHTAGMNRRLRRTGGRTGFAR